MQFKTAQHVFVSYSRSDDAFVRQLHDALAAAQRDVWVDWEDIPPSAEWRREIEQAIDSAVAVVFVISPESAQSQACRHECDYAVQTNKRIVPIVLHDMPGTQLPEPLAKLNWIFFRPQDDFQTSFHALLQAVDTDLDWVRAHSRLLVRAKEWAVRNYDESYLLDGTDLNEAENWLAHAQLREPVPSSLQVAYVAASRQGAVDLQRKQLRGFYVISLIYAGFQMFICYVYAFNKFSETQLMILSPLWVMGIVFGGFGLIFGRTSLRRSVIAAVVSGIGLYIFFSAAWSSL